DKGRFVDGWVTALNEKLEGDSFLRQAGAAFALARVARFTGEESYNALAKQAILYLLDATDVDAKDATMRYTPMPSLVLNRLGAAAWLVLAINELPAPTAEMLEKSEQLCNFIRHQARPDGSLSCRDAVDDGRSAADDLEAV